MKKIFILFWLLFIAFICSGQMKKRGAYFPDPFSISSINLTTDVVQNGWAIIGQSCAGCPSFFYQMVRTTNVHQGEDGIYYFYYYFMFYSNSHYANGTIASTYLINAKFYADEVLLVQSPYLLVEPGNQKFAAWIRTRNPNSLLRFDVDQMTVY